MVVLITGSDGFIGKHLVKKFISIDATVYGWTLNGVGKIGEAYKKVDLLDDKGVQQEIKRIKPDIIIHCAGCADVTLSVKEPLLDLKSNYITTHNLLFALKTLEIKECKFILLSSAAVYGNPKHLPMDEQAYINPLSPYALHKKAAEDICIYAKENCDIDTKIMRIFSVYGPGLRKQLFWDMYNKINETCKLELFGSGRESRDYIYIDDLVNAVMLISNVDSDEIIFNVANGEEVSIKKAAEVFVKTLNMDESIIKFMGARREGEPINWRADISRIKKLGYEREVSFEEGIKRYIDWLQNL